MLQKTPPPVDIRVRYIGFERDLLVSFHLQNKAYFTKLISVHSIWGEGHTGKPFGNPDGTGQGTSTQFCQTGHFAAM